MGALSVLTGIGNIGEQFGEAKDAVRKESEARSNKLREFSSQDAYLQLAKQQESRQQAEFEQRKKAGDLIEMKDGRIWSVSQGKFIDQQKSDPAQVFHKFFSTLDPRAQKILGPKAQVIAEQYPYDQKEMMKAMLSESDKAQAQIESEDKAALAEQNRREDASTKETQHREDLKSSEADRRADRAAAREQTEAFQRSMVPYRLGEKDLYANADEKRRADLSENMNENLTQLEDVVNRRPDLFGPHGAGLLTSLRMAVGTSDPDIAALKSIKEYLGMASLGAHSMRNASHVSQAADAVIASFRNSPEAVKAAIRIARASTSTFTADVNRPYRVTPLPNQQSQPKAGGGGGAAQRFTSGGKVYNIPADKVAEFKQDHPDAR